MSVIDDGEVIIVDVLHWPPQDRQPLQRRAFTRAIGRKKAPVQQEMTHDYLLPEFLPLV